MIDKMKIQLADWRDHAEINKLRKQLIQFNDGGLYELLNWPTYHVHAARYKDDIIGFTSVRLLANGNAEDVGTIVNEEFRGQDVASELKLTQIRDLITMGWTHMFATVKTEDAPAGLFARKLYGEPLGAIPGTHLGDLEYFGANVYHIQKALHNVRQPFPLSVKNHERLLHKATKAYTELSQLSLLGDIAMRKHRMRQEYRNG